jgi:hypothetical protein
MDCGRVEECNCRIKIDNSIVIIICGDIDVDRLRDSLKTLVDLKGNAKLVSPKSE